MIPNLDHLRLFVQVVDGGSVSAAAKLAHLTQPAATRNLQKLQEQLGVELFERQGRGLALTAAGRALVPLARGLLRQASDAAQEVTRVAQCGWFDLRLGTIDSIACYLLPQLVEPLQGAFAGLQLKVRTGRSAALLHLVETGQLDAAIVAWSGQPPAPRAERIAAYQLRFFGRAERFASLAHVLHDSELQQFPIVEIESMPGQPTLLRDDLPGWAIAHSLASVKALVMAGFGIGAMLRFMLTDNEAAQLVSAEHLPHDPACALWLVLGPERNDSRHSALEQELLVLLRDGVERRPIRRSAGQRLG